MAGFRSTGSLAATRSSFSAAWLDVGRVLVAGGSDNVGADLLTTEAFDPTTETWSAAGSLHNPHVLPPLVSTPTGAVLVGRDPLGVDAPARDVGRAERGVDLQDHAAVPVAPQTVPSSRPTEWRSCAGRAPRSTRSAPVASSR